MATLTNEQYQEKSKDILNSILEAVAGVNVAEGLHVVAGPVSFFLIGVADMMGRDRRKIMETFYKMIQDGADYQGETLG